MGNDDLCLNLSSETASLVDVKPERYAAIDRHECEGEPGERIRLNETALWADLFRSDAAEFETPAI
jgi:hypothetical protein